MAKYKRIDIKVVLGLLLILLSECKTHDKSIVIEHYFGEKLAKSMEGFFSRTDDVFCYYQNKNKKEPYFKVQIIDDNNLLYKENYCSIIDSIKIGELKDHYIFVYYYNVKGIDDEEEYLFFNETLGLLATYSYEWDFYFLLKQNNSILSYSTEVIDYIKRMNYVPTHPRCRTIVSCDKEN